MNPPSLRLDRLRSRRRLPVLAPVLAVLVLVVAGATGCSDDDEPATTPSSTTVPQADADDVLAALVDGVITPGYARLTVALREWTASVEGLCATPGTDGVERARQHWRESVTAYEATVAHDVGPSMELRLMSDLAFDPRPASIDELLAGGDPVDVGAMATRGANVRGLLAAEHALFGEPAAELATPAGARRCRYLASVAALAADAATAVSDQWATGDARAAFLAADGSDPDDAVPQLLNAATHAVKAVDETGLRDIAAAETYDDLPAGRRDGPGAFGLGARRARLVGAVSVIGSSATGLVALVAERSPETAERLEETAEQAHDAVDLLPASVAAAFGSDDAAMAVDAAADAVAALKVVLATEVASQLGVTITLSDSDGDS